MSFIEIDGGRKLCGSVKIQGSKNAVLPIMAASLLNRGESVIHNCPRLSDVDAAIEILEFLGCRVTFCGNSLTIDSSCAVNRVIPDELMLKMRSSVIFAGSMTAVFGEADISYPGGCELGARPIDLHLKAFRNLGIEVKEGFGRIVCRGRCVGGKVHLAVSSVGATENIMLAAALSRGETIVVNAATEPEICDLADFLNSMGAHVFGAGSSEIRIKGAERLYNTEYFVMSDRIVAQTYMAAVAACGGSAELCGTEFSTVEAASSVLEECGCEIIYKDENLFIKAPEKLNSVSKISTAPFPGFPTDSQAVMMAALCVADGTSVITENIFESRYKHVPELMRMGADISVNDRTAVVRGKNRLFGTKVSCTDLRGGAALCIGGLCAEGVSEINKICHIDRGYEDIVRDLALLGADIRREDG